MRYIRQGLVGGRGGCTCGCELALGQWDGDVVVFHHFDRIEETLLVVAGNHQMVLFPQRRPLGNKPLNLSHTPPGFTLELNMSLNLRKWETHGE